MSDVMLVSEGGFITVGEDSHAYINRTYYIWSESLSGVPSEKREFTVKIRKDAYEAIITELMNHISSNGVNW